MPLRFFKEGSDYTFGSTEHESVHTEESHITNAPDERVVRVPSEYPTMHQAIQGEAARIDAGNTVVRVLAESGHFIQETIECREGIWNHFKIDSEDRPLPVDPDFGPSGAIISVIDGAQGPTLRTLIDAQGQGEDGVQVERGSHMKCFSMTGVINAGRHCLQVKRASVTGASSIWRGAAENCVTIVEGSVAHLGGVEATGAGTHGVRVQRGAVADLSRSDKPCTVTGNSAGGLYVTEGATINAEGGDFSGNTANGIRCGFGSRVSAANANASNNGNFDLRNDSGGEIDVTGCQTTNGTPDIGDATVSAFNAVSSRGIMYEDS